MQQKESFSLKISKEKVGQKISSTPQRHTISSQRKLVASKKEHNHDNSSLKLGNSSRRTKSTCIRQLARTQGWVYPVLKCFHQWRIDNPFCTKFKEPTLCRSIVTTGQLGTIKETSPTILKAKEAAPTESGADASLVTKGLISPASRPSLQGKRFKTLPKEPNFHTIHVPKSCTKVQITCWV